MTNPASMSVEERLEAAYNALNKCRAIIKFHVKPEKCVSIDGDVFSSLVAYEEATTVLRARSGAMQSKDER